MRKTSIVKQAIAILFVVVTISLRTAEGAPFKLGIVQSLTGIAAEDGQNTMRALQLWALQANSSSPRVELLVEDDRSIPRDTVSAYQKLKEQGAEAFVVGPYGFTTESVIPLAGRDGIPILNSSGLLESFSTSGSNGFFSTIQ